MKILMLVDRKFPTDHVFLEEVYSRIFREKGHEIVWVMKSSAKTSSRMVKFWNQNKVFVIPSRFSGLLEYFFQPFDLFFLYSLCKKENFDIIQVRNDVIMGFFASVLSKRFGSKFVIQLSHLKAEETRLFAHEGLYGNKFINYFVAWVEKSLRQMMLKKADLVFPISEQMLLYFRELGVKKPRMKALPLGVSLEVDPHAIDSSTLPADYQKRQGIRFVYIGTLSRSRKLHIMLESFAKLKAQGILFTVFVVGDGKSPDDLVFLKDKAKDLDLLAEVIFTGRVARNQVPKYLKLADVGLSPVPFNEVFKRSSITKLGEYMNMALPVVATRFPEQELLMKESGAGICVDYSLDSFADALYRICSLDDTSRKELGEKGRAYIRKYRNTSILADVAEQEYFDVLS